MKGAPVASKTSERVFEVYELVLTPIAAKGGHLRLQDIADIDDMVRPLYGAPYLEAEDTRTSSL